MFLDKVLSIWDDPDKTYKLRFKDKGLSVRQFLDNLCMVKDGRPDFTALKSGLHKESSEYNNEQLVTFNALLKVFSSLEDGYNNGEIPSEIDSILELILQLRGGNKVASDTDNYPSGFEVGVRSLPVLDFINKFSLVDSAIFIDGFIYKSCATPGVCCFVYNSREADSLKSSIVKIGNKEFFAKVSSILSKLLEYDFPVLVIDESLRSKLKVNYVVGEVLFV